MQLRHLHNVGHPLRTAISLMLLILISSSAMAQSDRQFCVRAYEDRNANARRDTGEPILTRGIGANLLDAEGVVVASALLDESPTAAQGVICFQFLEPGSYSIQVTSAEYLATTANTMNATISDGQLPTVVEYGGRSALAAITVDPDAAAQPQNIITRLAVSGAGALGVMTVMAIVGFVIYLILRSQNPQPAYDPRTTTGSMRVVRTDTGQYRAVPPTDTGQFRRPPTPTPTDTGAMRRVDVQTEPPPPDDTGPVQRGKTDTGDKYEFDFDDL